MTLRNHRDFLRKLIKYCAKGSPIEAREASTILKAIVDKHRLEFHEDVWQQIHAVLDGPRLQFESDLRLFEIVMSEEDLDLLRVTLVKNLARYADRSEYFSYPLINYFGDETHERTLAELFIQYWRKHPKAANYILLCIYSMNIWEDLMPELRTIISSSDDFSLKSNAQSKYRLMKATGHGNVY